MGVVVIDNDIYLFGGYDGYSTMFSNSDHFSWSTQTWGSVASLPAPWTDATAVARDNDTIFFTGGTCSCGSRSGYSNRDVLRYSISSNTWGKPMRLPAVTHTPGSTVVGGKMYVVGGESGGTDYNVLSSVTVLDLTTNTISSIASLPAPRVAPVVYVPRTSALTTSIASLTSGGLQTSSLVTPGSSISTTVLSSESQTSSFEYITSGSITTGVNIQTDGTTGAEAVMSDGTAVIVPFSLIVFMFL
jgi:hypothetical protein